MLNDSKKLAPLRYLCFLCALWLLPHLAACDDTESTPDAHADADADADAQDSDVEDADEPDGSDGDLEIDADSSDASDADPGDADVDADDGDPPEHAIQAIFTINAHDWVLLERSSKTLNRVVDIHESHDIPVDIYFTDPLFQKCQRAESALLDRLRDSPLVAVSYHVRPPSPYYPDYDHVGLEAMSDEDLSALLLEYETHALDLVTGEPMADRSGGFSHIASFLGYSPPAVGTNRGHDRIGRMLFEIYADMGATFKVVHGRNVDFGETYEDVFLRPEHVEIRLYEYDEGQDAETVLEAEIAEKACPDGPETCPDRIYMNMKFHENDFYAETAPWRWIYYPMDPPFELDAYEGRVDIKSDETIENLWAIYEGAVRYVAENPERFRAINMLDLREDVEGL